MKIARKFECEWCGNQLDDQEIRSPREKGMCDECFHEHREFICSRCDNYEEKQYQHRFLVVWTAQSGMPGPDIEPGIYEIVEYPYHGGPIIGSGWLYNSAIRRLKKMPDWNKNDLFPCGHLCLACQKTLGLRQTKKGRELHKNDDND